MERSRSILLSDVYLLGDRQGIVDLNAEIANGTFNFRVSE
jgi:hypothetical protein